MEEVVSLALLAERCGRVVTLAAEEVVGIAYMAFIDDLSYQGSGSTEAMSAAQEEPVSGPLQQSTSWVCPCTSSIQTLGWVSRRNRK
ncbi:hypothetical protein EK904_004596 [Melospiza melodia maxima]|nr:hypothetical protein EK904_004596 [Melospiza melodia maxima]